MSKKFIIVLSSVVVVLIVFFLAWNYVFRPAKTSVASNKPDFETDAVTLLSEFENNENAANDRYLDKIILITGRIGTIQSDTIGVTVYLTEDGISGILCRFSNEVSGTDTLKEGQEISVKGICSGYLMDVVLNKCSLQE